MTRKRNKKFLYLIIILVILVAAVAVFLICKNLAQKNDNEQNETEVALEENKKKEEKNSSDNKEEDDNIPEKQVPKYDGNDPNKAESLSGVITYAEVIGNNFMVGVNIDQFLASGSCKLSLNQSGRTIYSVNANIVADVATSYCDGFTVPVSEIGSGEYEVVVEISSGNKTGTIRGKGNV